MDAFLGSLYRPFLTNVMQIPNDQITSYSELSPLLRPRSRLL